MWVGGGGGTPTRGASSRARVRAPAPARAPAFSSLPPLVPRSVRVVRGVRIAAALLVVNSVVLFLLLPAMRLPPQQEPQVQQPPAPPPPPPHQQHQQQPDWRLWPEERRLAGAVHPAVVPAGRADGLADREGGGGDVGVGDTEEKDAVREAEERRARELEREVDLERARAHAPELPPPPPPPPPPLVPPPLSPPPEADVAANGAEAGDPDLLVRRDDAAAAAAAAGAAASSVRKALAAARQEKDHARAVRVLEAAVEEHSDSFELWSELGLRAARVSKSRTTQMKALNAYVRAFDLRADTGVAERAAGIAKKQKQWGTANRLRRFLFDHRPSFETRLQLVKSCMKASEWSTFERDVDDLVREAREMWYSRGQAAVDVFTGLHFPFNLTEITGWNAAAAARIKSSVLRGRGRAVFEYPPAERRRRNERIRVGYVSHDLRWHSVGLVAQSLFGLHDRSRFEVFCYFVHDEAVNPNRRDRIFQKIRRECEHHVELGAVPFDTWIDRIRGDEIDILVDMMVYTAGHRIDLFVVRPAPVTVAWLGLGSSTGADFIDYLIADPTTVPKDKGWDSIYAEKLVRMPFTYHIADHKQFYGVQEHFGPERRAEIGLRRDAFVFCNFANVIRWSPTWFNSVCNIVRRVPRSQIMMRRANEWSATNLYKAARDRGLRVNETHPLESDIVLIEKEDVTTHMIKKSACDLNLDTPYYNGHSCGLDLFWAGTPVVTLLGQTLAGRAAASFSMGAGISDTFAETWSEYEDIAASIALDRARYERYDRHLHEDRLDLPLFDTRRFVRNLENAYEQMMERWLQGLPPVNIDVVDQGPQPQGHQLYPDFDKRLAGVPFFYE